MSRTKRNIKHACINARRIKFKSQLTNTYYFVQEMREFSFDPRNRDKAMASRFYLNNWNDHLVHAYLETDHAIKETLSERIGFKYN